jgi:FKBP-type peptidyl-prolyl cis-trans isomerase SlyD
MACGTQGLCRAKIPAMQIESPCVVSLSWRLEDTLGELIDELPDPVEFLFGGDDLLPKVEEALAGQEAGFGVTLHLEPEHAFGEYNSSLVFFESRSLFPDSVEPGLQFEGPPEGSTTPGMPGDALYTVTEVYDSHVVLDGNHPLAGIALVLQLTVHDVREASDDEVERRTVSESPLAMLGASAGHHPLH